MSQKELVVVRLLNDLIGELVGATNSFRIYQTNFFNERLCNQSKAVIYRIHVSFILLSLAKLNEFYKNYKQYIPSNLREDAKKIFQREIQSRGIIHFRNKVVGHLHDKKTNQPLERAEIQERLDKIIGSDINEFLLWINDRDVNGDSVVGLCEKIRNAITATHNLTND